MNRVKQFFKDWKSKEAAERIKRTKDGFEVKDCNGSLYLTLWGTAFFEIDPKSSAEDIVALLNDARITAVKYNEKKEI